MKDLRAKGTGDRFRRDALKWTRNIFWGLLLLLLLNVLELIRYMEPEMEPGRLARTFLIPLVLGSFVVAAYTFYCYRRLSEREPDEEEANTDPATGAFTMPYINSCLEHEYRRADENGITAAVVYLDMVNLERVNREFGHTVGDIVLKAMADLMARNCRAGDVLGRAGGDEFLLVMPETSLKEARPVMRRIRQAVQEYRLDLNKRGVIDYLDCRCGVAAFPAEGETPQDITVAARENMAEAATVG